MRKHTLLLCLLISFVIHGQSIGDIFKSMPSELLPGVSEGNKTMLIVDSTQTTIPYIFGEIKKVKQSSNYLKITTSEVGNTQLKLLPIAPDSLIVAVIKTVCGGVDVDVCNSTMSFYTTDWAKLDSETLMPLISPELFMDSSKKELDNYKYALSLPDIYPISATFNEDGTDLTLTFHYKDRLTNMQLREFETYLESDSVILKWNGKTFQ